MNQSGEDASSQTQKAIAVKRRYQSDLMKKANVIGVGIGYRQKDGRPTDQISLVVMVSQKMPSALLNPQDILPQEIDGIPVDVQEVGRLKVQ